MSKYPGRIVTDLAPAGYSVFFDGTGDYLSLPNDAAFSGIGSNDWTVEAWVYSTATATSQNIITISGNTGAWAAIRLELSTANALYLVSSITGSAWAIDYAAGTVTVNAWNHVAATRSGTSVRLYVNGSQVGVTQTLSGSLLSGTVNRIGIVSNDSSFPFRGYISNVRYIRGTALYTGTTYLVPTQLLNVTNTQLLTCNSPALVDQSTNNFTITANGNAAVSTLTPFTAYVPYNPALGASTPGVWTLDEALQAKGTRQWNMYDPSFNSTTLLLHGNPTNGTAWLTDVSTNNFALTTNGDAKPANLSPFSLTTYGTSGSGYFDGTGDYLSNTSAALISNTVSTFTVECWLYLTANPPANGNDISAMCTLDGQPTGPTNFMSFGPKDNRRLYLFWFDGSVKSAVGGTVLALNTWYHIVCVVNSNAIQFYVNGVAETMTGTTTLTNRSGSQGNFAIGSSSAGQITGYISNFRVTTTAVYTGAFTTPTAPLTAISGTRILTLQNSQSANNNAFLDSSSNNFLITRNGNTTQGSFSPFSQTGWSNFFGSSTANLKFASNAAFAVGNSNFTVECFVNFNAWASTNQRIFVQGQSGTDNLTIQRDSGANNLVVNIQGSSSISYAWSPNIGQWYHIAVVKSGTGTGQVAVYIDGVSVATGTSSTSISQNQVLIGGIDWASSYNMQGYISNLRYTIGAALYTSNFTPSTTPLTTTSQGATASQVELLTCQSNSFIDNSSNGFSMTVNGTTSIQAFSPFYPTAAYTPATVGGSGYFDGSGDYLETPNNAALALGSSDFSVEWWEYRTTLGAEDTAIQAPGTYGFLFNYYDVGFPRFFLSTSSGSWNVFNNAATGAISANTWNHFVVTRSGTAFRVFLNGVLSIYATGSGSVVQPNNNFIISGNAAQSYFPGYISNVRVVRGSIPTSYQTSSTTTSTSIFTPPTAPATTTSQGATSGDVRLLLNFTNAGIVDSTAKNALETVGNAQISTTQSKFGGSSILFNASANTYLSQNLATTDLYAFGSGDFTIECWLYLSSTAGIQTLLDGRPNGTASAAVPTIYINAGSIRYYVSGADRIIGSTLSTGQWYHIAIARSGTSTRMFINGTQAGSTYTDSTVYLNSANRPFIGGDSNAPNNNLLNGYIDDFRITKGFARYTGAFTPQTSQWQDE